MRGTRIPVTVLAGALALAVAVVVVVLLLRRDDGPEFGPPVVDTFEVNTYEWDGGAAMEALITGTLAFTDEGCTMLVEPGPGGPSASAVFFPNATGVVYENGVRGVVDGYGRIFGIEGETISYGGGSIHAGEGLQTSWDERCSGTPFSQAYMVQDTTTREQPPAAPSAPSVVLPTAPTDADPAAR
jgi:hypothetical protein